MKRPSGKRREKKAAKLAPVISGRDESIHLSAEFVLLAKRCGYKAGFLAECVLHQCAMDHPDTKIVLIESDEPLEPEVFDLGEEGA
jgi:hypothetical protein